MDGSDAIGARFRAAGEAFLGQLAEVPADAWAAPTPDAEWSVADLVDHVVTVFALGANLIDPGVFAPERPLAPARAASVARDAFDAAAAVIEAPGAPAREVDGAIGSVVLGDQYRFFAADVAVHTWDLAAALGTDLELSPELVELAFAVFSPVVEAGREAGAFGPEVEVPDGASRQDALLGLLGRRR